ncbi:MAG: hypothetical protein GY781_01615 [Gammaproteobacteria bacterium]|nr:hypothetical protein [Gammaproteobacteria bacterium]
MGIEQEWHLRKGQFFKLWPQNDLPKIENIWNILTKHYSEPSRFYHTREHILCCLQQFDKIKHLLNSSDAVQMSIWFHDVIYNIEAKDNEEQSALFFSQLSKGFLDDSFINKVSEFINSTKHLTATPSFDQAYLLDIDLSSFGSERVKFYINGDNLRKEAQHLTDKQYTKNQIIFFQMLLNRKQIFFTDYFHKKYESIALGNINHQMQKMLTTI